MSRALKYDIPGEDWRRTSLDLADLGVKGLFQTGSEAPKRFVLEVGFGRGEFLLDLAAGDPDTAFIGVEVSYKRVLKMARKVAVARPFTVTTGAWLLPAKTRFCSTKFLKNRAMGQE